MNCRLYFSGHLYPKPDINVPDKNGHDKKLFQEYRAFPHLEFVYSTWSSLAIVSADHTEYGGFIKKYLNGLNIKKFTIFMNFIFFIEENQELNKIEIDSAGNECIIDCCIKVSQIVSTTTNVYFLTEEGIVGKIDPETLSICWAESIGTKVDQICSGAEHLLVKTEDGMVFSHGIGSKGQLGHGDCFNVDSEIEFNLKPIHFFTGLSVKTISCGKWHNCVLSEIGDLYCWGWNSEGQMGIECPMSALPVLVDVEGEENLIGVACGSRHSLVLGESGTVYCCGTNEFGQLANTECSGEGFKKVNLPGVAKAIWCGDMASFIAL